MMGLEARWICWTCKQCYDPGWRDMLTAEFKNSIEEVTQYHIDRLVELVEHMEYVIENYGNDCHRIVRFLRDLIDWLCIHIGHYVRLTNDHDESIDWDGLERIWWYDK